MGDAAPNDLDGRLEGELVSNLKSVYFIGLAWDKMKTASTGQEKGEAIN